MLAVDGIGGLIIVALWLYCVFDVLFTPDGQTRNLPKLAWVFIVILLLDVGALLWLVAGKPWGQRRETGSTPSARQPMATDAGRAARRMPSNPDDDAEFLAGLRQRVDEQRRRAREQGSTSETEVPHEPGDTTDS